MLFHTQKPPVCVCAAILSGLRNLQEKIRRLELEKGQTELSLHSVGENASNSLMHSEKVAKRLSNHQTDTKQEMNGHSSCNQGQCMVMQI